MSSPGTQNGRPCKPAVRGSLEVLRDLVSTGTDLSDPLHNLAKDALLGVLQVPLAQEYAENQSDGPREPRSIWTALKDRVSHEGESHALAGLFSVRAEVQNAIDSNFEALCRLFNEGHSPGGRRTFFQIASDALEDWGTISFESVDGEIKARWTNDQRRVSGTYLTPLPLARRCCANAIKAFDFGTKTARLEGFGDGGQPQGATGTLSVLDPACGTGSMLLAMVDTLIQNSAIAPDPSSGGTPYPDLHRSIVRNCLYGVDADPLAVALVRAVLWLESTKSLRDPVDELTDHIRCGDSLLGSTRPGDSKSRWFSHDSPGTSYRQGLEPMDWPDAFPGIWAHGGFDIVVTNPPWERLKVQAREFLVDRAPQLASLPDAATREDELGKNGVARIELKEAKEKANAFAAAVRESDQYRWTNRGSLNLYSLFAERSLQLIHDLGATSLIVPTGIATDYYTQDFFRHLMDEGRLVSLHDFENRQKIFPDIDGRMRFCLLTLSNAGKSEAAEFGFFAHSIDDLDDPDRRIALGPEDIAALNPNTKTCPLVRSKDHLRILQDMHEHAPILSAESSDGGTDSPWNVRYVRMFDMSLDSDKFHRVEDIIEGELTERGNILTENAELTRVYEGRMIDTYNHRSSHARNAPGNLYRSGLSDEATDEDLRRPTFTVAARYYLPLSEVNARMEAFDYEHEWFIGFKDITSATNSRTMVASVIPYTAVGNKVPLLLIDGTAREAACFLANLNSLAYDFACRQKIGNVTLNWYIVRQTPVLPPSTYEVSLEGSELSEWVSEKVAELTYTAEDLRPWGEALGFSKDPYEWNGERRRRIQIDLDALYFNLYGLDLADVRMVLDSFPSLRKREESKFGDYRLRDEIITRYRELAGHLQLPPLTT